MAKKEQSQLQKLRIRLARSEGVLARWAGLRGIASPVGVADRHEWLLSAFERHLSELCGDRK